jgi:uncharacterized protein (TIGR02265 family)
MDTISNLRERAEKASPEAQCLGVYFSASVEFVRHELGDGEADALLQSGLVPKRVVPLLKYPVASLLQLIAAASERLVRAGFNEQKAIHAVGQGIAKTYLETPMGKVLVMANGGNANRILTHVPAAYYTTFTFGDRRYARRADNAGEMSFRGDLLGSTMTEGIFQAGMKLSAGVDMKIDLVDESANCVDFRLVMHW